MAWLVAYLDESGVGQGVSQATPIGFVFSVGGFVAPADTWGKFVEQWTAILLGEGLPNPPHLHMNKFLHSRGDFEGWQPARKERVLGALIDTIGSLPIVGHAHVTIRGSPKDWASAQMQLIMSRAYIATGYVHCIDALAKKASMFLGAEERIAFVCGRNEQQGRLRDIFETAKDSYDNPVHHRLGAISFDSPERLPPLQASDLLAYEARRRAIDQRAEIPKRRSLVRLESAGRITFRLADPDTMEPVMNKVLSDPEYPAHCAEFDKAKRRRQRRKKSIPKLKS